MAYEWLFFDADGTLFDYDAAEGVALQRTFEALGLGYAPDYRQVYRKVNAAIWREFEAGQISAERLRTGRFERLFERIHLPADAAEFSRLYLANLAQAAQLIEGAEAVVRSLAQHYRLAIITNGLKDVQRPRLESSTIAAFFPLVVISEEIGVVKPEARFFDVALSMAGGPHKDKVLVIGDNPGSDIQGGLNAGIDTCWYNPRRLAADPHIPSRYMIHHLDDLLGLLEI